MPSFTELENPEYNLAAEVYAEDGVLLGKISIENRTWTDYKDLSPYLVDALISTEDIRYYRHSGIDIRGLGQGCHPHNIARTEYRRRKHNNPAACKTALSPRYCKRVETNTDK